jgi:hypothetical protein
MNVVKEIGGFVLYMQLFWNLFFWKFGFLRQFGRHRLMLINWMNILLYKLIGLFLKLGKFT